MGQWANSLWDCFVPRNHLNRKLQKSADFPDELSIGDLELPMRHQRALIDYSVTILECAKIKVREILRISPTFIKLHN